MASGPDKDRLGYTINHRLEVGVKDRGNYPELSKVFKASDRNFAALKEAQKAETLRNKGGC